MLVKGVLGVNTLPKLTRSISYKKTAVINQRKLSEDFNDFAYLDVRNVSSISLAK